MGNPDNRRKMLYILIAAVLAFSEKPALKSSVAALRRGGHDLRQRSIDQLVEVGAAEHDVTLVRSRGCLGCRAARG